LPNSVKKVVAWPLRVPNSVTAKGMKQMSGRLLTPPVLLELGLLSTAHGDSGRRRARNAEQTLTHGIKIKF
jgi:hypothetical protein